MISFIPVGNSVYILGLFLFQSHCGLDLLGEILAVIIVNEILEGYIYANSLALMLGAVVMVID